MKSGCSGDKFINRIISAFGGQFASANNDSKLFVHYKDAEIWPGDGNQTDDELLDHAQQTGNTANPPMGTCRMGPKEKTDGVVDHQQRVHGVRNLRVADASVMLMIPSANLKASTLMIGEKAADMIIHDRLHY